MGKTVSGRRYEGKVHGEATGIRITLKESD
jgi:hypothetical protein